MPLTLLLIVMTAAPCDREFAETCGKLEKNDTDLTRMNWRKCIIDHTPSLSRKCQPVAKKLKDENEKNEDLLLAELQKANKAIDAELAKPQPKTDINKAIADLETNPSYLLKRKQSEAKLGLKQIFQAERSAFAERDVYADDLVKAGAAISSEHYFFGFSTQLAGKSLRGRSLSDELKKRCPECGVTKTGFKAIAIGNIDDDDTLDVWTIDDHEKLIQLSDDAKN